LHGFPLHHSRLHDVKMGTRRKELLYNRFPMSRIPARWAFFSSVLLNDL
jgi:hypothetical protein